MDIMSPEPARGDRTAKLRKMAAGSSQASMSSLLNEGIRRLRKFLPEIVRDSF